MMAYQTMQLKLVKSTKGTHVYGDDSDDATIPTVYIKKSGLPNNPPKTITMSLEYEAND